MRSEGKKRGQNFEMPIQPVGITEKAVLATMLRSDKHLQLALKRAKDARTRGDEALFERFLSDAQKSARTIERAGSVALPKGLQTSIDAHVRALHQLRLMHSPQSGGPAKTPMKLEPVFLRPPGGLPMPPVFSSPKNYPSASSPKNTFATISIAPFFVDQSLVEKLAAPPARSTEHNFERTPNVVTARRELAQLLTLDPFSTRKDKWKLDAPGITRAMGTIEVRHEHRSERRQFRVSYVSSKSMQGDLLVGSSVGSGTYAKVRPSLILKPDGERIEVAIKELRSTPFNPLHPDKTSKIPVNRHGSNRNIAVVDYGAALAEHHEMVLLAQPFMQIFDVTKVDNKFYILAEHMDGGDLRRIAAHINPSNRTAFARFALTDLIKHYQHIDRQGFVHADGKLENALISFRNEKIVASDFGHATKLTDLGVVSHPTAVTFLSPEISHFAGSSALCSNFGRPHDIWTLGISAIRLLAGDIVNLTSLTDPAEVLRMRESLLPDLASENMSDGSMKDLSTASDQAFDHFYVTQMMQQRDTSLTNFIFRRMLEPNPAQRATLIECDTIFTQLTQALGMEKSSIFKELSANFASTREAFEKLHHAADLLEPNFVT